MQNIDISCKKPKSYSGFIIVRVSGQFAYQESETLEEFARKNKLENLSRLLEQYPPSSTRRTIKSVSMEKLRELEAKAKKSDFPPLHSLSNYWRLDFRDSAANHDEVVRAFQSLPEIEVGYKEMFASDPTIEPANDVFSGQQGYLKPAAQGGIDALWAWGQGGDGSGIGFIDLEQGWIETHEDLAAASPTLVFQDNRNGATFVDDDGVTQIYLGNHGTAVLGEVVGRDNERGIVGIAPAVSYVKMVSHYDADSDTVGHVADAIVAAITHMSAGDVLLLEVQKGDPPVPTESQEEDFDAIRLAVANGIIVVEAGGNGGLDLDAWINDAGDAVLQRDSRYDSGAIMVGASESALPLDRWVSSNHGSRIDCFAWGENVVTAGYGDLSEGTSAGRDDDYTGEFQGTSSASPIITGAALILQGLYKAASGTVLSPLQMRALLSNPATGTAQGTGVEGNIGVMPNLRNIIEVTLELTPDIYLRDSVGDNGHVPSAGAISTSPDIIVRPVAVADPAAAFGEASGTENSSSQGSSVEFGQNNFVYARMKNRGGSDANGATATVYWSEVSTLVTPDLWNLIGTSSPVNVPVGDTLVVTPPIIWNSADIPAVGHYCFVGILNHPQDGAPPIPGPANFDMNDFTALIRNYNNVTWRNFNVIDAIITPPGGADGADGAGGADEAGAQEKLEFNITGAPDRERKFDIEFIRALPKGAKAWLEIPADLFASLELPGAEVKRDEAGQTVSVLLPGVGSVRLDNIALPKSAKYKCRLLITGGAGYEKGAHRIAVRQIFEDFEVGRVTWELKRPDQDPARKPNLKTGSSLWCWVLFFLFIPLLIWFLLTLMYFLTRSY